MVVDTNTVRGESFYGKAEERERERWVGKKGWGWVEGEVLLCQTLL